MKTDKLHQQYDVPGKGSVSNAINGPYQVDGSHPFYIPRRDTRTWPKNFPETYQDNNFSKFFQQYIVDGWKPKEPIFDDESNIFTMGSCFAMHIQTAMQIRKRELGISNNGDNNVLHVPSSVNNAFGIRQFFDWALENKIDSTSYWYEGDTSRYVPSDEREKYNEWLKSSNGFVFTFGLSEIWKDLETNTVFWRAVPADLYKENKIRYKFELSTVEQNIEQIKKLIDVIHRNIGNVPIILTISPVPFLATFRGVSAITANSVSKAILRVAVDQIMSLNLENVYYWPSYEVFKECSAHIPDNSFIRDTNHHPVKVIVQKVVNEFFSTYYKTGKKLEG